MSGRRASERGVVLIHAILFMALLTATVSVLAGTAIARAQAVRTRADRAQAYWAAEAGVAAARAAAMRGVSPVLRGEAGRATWRVEARPGAGDGATLVATGTCGGIERAIRLRPAPPGDRARLVRVPER